MLSKTSTFSSQETLVSLQDSCKMMLNEKGSFNSPTVDLGYSSSASTCSLSPSPSLASSSPVMKSQDDGSSPLHMDEMKLSSSNLPSFPPEILSALPEIISMQKSTAEAKLASVALSKPSLFSTTIQAAPSATPRTFLTGLGTQYPPYLYTAAEFEMYVRSVYDVDHAPGLQKLLQINRMTAIQTRAIALPITHPFHTLPNPPTINEIDAAFNQEGIALAISACHTALSDAGLAPSDITHMVSVTSTNFGTPGFDFRVAQKLGLSGSVDRALIAGVGCAGGLAALRTAANISNGASARKKAARILVLALEMSSLSMRRGLDEAKSDPNTTAIAPILFGDGAAAMVLCNEVVVGGSSGGGEVYELLDWGCEVIPDSAADMMLNVTSAGFKAHIGKNVPVHAITALPPMLARMLPSFTSQRLPQRTDNSPPTPLEPVSPLDIDWALHPGGIAIIKGTQKALGLSNDQLRATYDVYSNKGNTASVTVFSVLDSLRRMGEGRENVVAASFGPGMMCEMATLRRCRR